MTIDPNLWLNVDHARIFRRRITSNGTIQIDRETYYIGTEFAKQQVQIEVDAYNQRFIVAIEHTVVQILEIRGLHETQLDFQTYLLVIKQEARSTEKHRHLLWMKQGDIA